MLKKRITKTVILSIILVFAFVFSVLAAETKMAEAIKGTPVIDGEIEAAWDAAPKIVLTNYVDGNVGSAWGKAMWDENNLYVLMRCTDDDLDDTAEWPHGHDSVEVYVDQNNAKKSIYQKDDIQLRVNFKNIVTSGGGTYYNTIKDTLKSAAKVVDDGFVVELAIPWTQLEPTEGTIIGFDLQYNNGSGGDRITNLKWNDTADLAHANPGAFGELKLVKEASGGGGNEPPKNNETPKTGDPISTFVYFALATLALAGGMFMRVRRKAVNR